MHPVVRVLFERAEARRASLLQLASVVPDDFWGRRAQGDEWRAADHIAHALSTDGVLSALLLSQAVASLESLSALRQASFQRARGLSFPELLARAASERAALHETLSSLEQEGLESVLLVATRTTPWQQPVSITRFAYLEAWSSHDPEHEQAIREAIATTPDLSAVAHVRKLR